MAMAMALPVGMGTPLSPKESLLCADEALIDRTKRQLEEKRRLREARARRDASRERRRANYHQCQARSASKIQALARGMAARRYVKTVALEREREYLERLHLEILEKERMRQEAERRTQAISAAALACVSHVIAHSLSNGAIQIRLAEIRRGIAAQTICRAMRAFIDKQRTRKERFSAAHLITTAARNSLLRRRQATHSPSSLLDASLQMKNARRLSPILQDAEASLSAGKKRLPSRATLSVQHIPPNEVHHLDPELEAARRRQQVAMQRKKRLMREREAAKIAYQAQCAENERKQAIRDLENQRLEAIREAAKKRAAVALEAEKERRAQAALALRRKEEANHRRREEAAERRRERHAWVERRRRLQEREAEKKAAEKALKEEQRRAELALKAQALQAECANRVKLRALENRRKSSILIDAALRPKAAPLASLQPRFPHKFDVVDERELSDLFTASQDGPQTSEGPAQDSFRDDFTDAGSDVDGWLLEGV